MRIHSPQAHRRAPASFSDYFYNYFTLGLVDMTDHEVNLIILIKYTFFRMLCLMESIIS